MDLTALLAELRENILHDRSDRAAGGDDFLWSDATLVRYINEAERRFARLGLVIRDGTTTEVCQVTLVAGQSEYALHPSVMAVISARHDDDPADLARAGRTAFSIAAQPDPLYFDPSQAATLTPGTPRAFSTDEYLVHDDNGSVSVVTMKVYPEPTADEAGNIIHLRVIRLPLDQLTVNNMRAVPEIPEDHHIDMLDWAAYLALRVVDVDAGMPARAREFRESFEQHVREARRSAMRKLFAPQTWGFGRNGFAWER